MVNLLFLKPFTKSETGRTLIETYSVQEYSEFKNLVHCFSENANVVIARLIDCQDVSLEEVLIAYIYPLDF